MIIEGKVIEGDKKARTLGFPTINIKIEEKISPGIYAGLVILDGVARGAAIYIGKNNPEILEAHIFDFDDNVYEKVAKVNILDKVRDDFPEEDQEKLKEMIKNDIEMIKIEIRSHSKEIK